MASSKDFLKNKAKFALAALTLAFFVFWPQYKAEAIPTEVVVDVPATTKNVTDNIKETSKKWWQTWAAKLVGSTLRNTINRIAYDAATAIATAGEGQKPLWIVEDFDTYIENLGDAAAGDFIAGLGEKWEIDLCQPVDPTIKARIGLGLVNKQRPQAPNCTLSQLAGNYASAYEKYEAMKTGDYLKAVQVAFEPGGSEIGTAFTLFGRTEEADLNGKDKAGKTLEVEQGWLNVRNIAGKMKGVKDNTKTSLELSQQNQSASLLSTTGDALVDAANIFLNQLAYEGMQRGLRELGRAQNTSAPYNYSSSLFESVVQYGEKMVSEKLSSFIKPRFNVRSDYNILGELSVCVDKKNPGPNNCVIDANFSQAISEKLTVAEAFEKGYLHPDWVVSDDSQLENTYTLRSASILRKFRIVPVGWERAIQEGATKDYPVTLMDLMACFSANDKYEFSSSFPRNDAVWCAGLVDPNWLLKAPLGSCLKQGAGGQVLSSLQSRDENGLSTLQISRADDYCADEQTCIKENSDGSCAVMGYCNEEKRTWDFNADSCEPVYNTCQDFTNLSTHQSIAYLDNTLDYGTCDAGNVGCKQYVYGGTYNVSNDSVTWDTNQSLYLNNQAKDCNSKDEGCSKLLRGKPGWNNVNFVTNSDFSANAVGDSLQANNLKWPVNASVANITVYDGTKALYLEGGSSVSVYSDSSRNVLPQGITVIPGWSYSLSAEVYLVDGYQAAMSFTEDNINSQTMIKGSWQTLKVSVLTRDQDIQDLRFSINGTGPSVKMYVRNIQLTPNDYVSSYANYASYPTYEKLIPAYLESVCYVNSGSGVKDYRLKDNAPDICRNFARKCNIEEVGCDMFKADKDGFKAAAKAQPADYCQKQCAGYDTYIAHESYFYNAYAENIIPANSKSCSAQSAGCSGFTNLDSMAQGGEEQEYYTYVRQCIKPDINSCGDFYSWEGTAGGGYQLKAASLRKDNNGNPFLVDSSLASACTKEIYYLPTSDPRFNPDCREFYNKNGSITYAAISNTFSCSSDCHPYRLNQKNIDPNRDAASCTGADKHWDAAQNSCYVCKNGGTWSNQYNACIYNTVPSEGIACSAVEEGCREYNGNGGGNLRLIANYNFESDTAPFTGNLSQSIESTSKDGHSLSINRGEIEADVSNMIREGSSYVIKFMAKAASSVTLNFYLENGEGDKLYFNANDSNKEGDLVINGNNSWNLYEINVPALNHRTDGEKLKINASGQIFIDNIIITEISDRFYLIKGSSNIPDSCHYDIFGKYQGPNYNLGCASYKDSLGNQHYLHRFSELCQDSAAGCEQMIQTNSSLNPYPKNINLNNMSASCAAGSSDCLSVSGHKIVYAVYDPSKLCVKDDAGCTRFAYSQVKDGVQTWVDKYKKNLPDDYTGGKNGPILCQRNEVGCEAWSYGENAATTYFKDPGTNVCVFKSGAWYRALEKRCDLNNDNVLDNSERANGNCNSDADCGRGGTIRCLSVPCDVTYLKTIGNGGYNGAVPTPSNAAGICNSDSAGCSEFIDPVSSYMNNILLGGKGSSYTVKQNALYTIVAGSGTVNITAPNLRVLGADNQLSFTVPAIQIPAGASRVFHTGLNSSITVSGINTNTTLKETIINYKKVDILDTKTCNGVVNSENGCILFNNRSRSGGALKFNALATAEGQAAASCASSASDCSANQVIKVRPDRVCSRWLSCTSYTEDPVTFEKTCYSLGECDKLDERNECANILPPSTTNRTVESNANATGYSLLNNYYIGSMTEVGQNADAHFDFESSNINLSCKRLDNSNKPCEFTSNINKDSLVLEPANSPAGIEYGAHGKGYLRVFAYYRISPLPANSYINVYGGQDYYVNYLVNTKNSLDSARIIISDDKGVTIASATDSAPQGWERKVLKFTPAGTGLKKIKIYLTSDANPADTQTSYVYFDDINIEPVLKVGRDEYIAKECRLYPGADSLTCLSINNNVIKDGMYGYCLQHDPLNPKVCLMWYPVEKISPVSRVNQNTLGYKGKFPLYYCTEVDGNFQLLKKIKAKRVATYRDDSHDGSDGWVDTEASGCGKKYFDDADCRKFCGDCTNYYLWVTTVEMNYNHERMYCVPKPNIGFIEDKKRLNTFPGEESGCSQEYIDSAWVPYKGSFQFTQQGSCDRSTCENINEVENNDPALAVYDNSKPAASESELLYAYNQDPDKVFQIKCNKFTQLVDADGANMAWSDRISRSSIYPTTTPAYFVGTATGGLNPSGSNDNSLNKNYVSGINQIYFYGRNREDVPFGAAVIPSDYNLIGSKPIALRNQYSSNMNETIFAGRPYGCSTLNATTTSPGCPYIGQCSMNPNIFCLYTGNSNIDKRNCSSAGAGQCVKLWENPLGMTAEIASQSTSYGQCNEYDDLSSGDRLYFCSNNGKSCGSSSDCDEEITTYRYVASPKDSINILSKIFAKSYASYKLNSDTSNPAYEGSNTNLYDSSMIGKCPDNVRPNTHPASFCKVYPSLSNMRISKMIGNTAIGVLVQTKNGISTAAVNESGLYRLSFNSKVDKEQQPLKQVIIDWGDSIQVVTNVDDKPADKNIPHFFYHYYSGNYNYAIKVKIVDNWETYTCRDIGNRECDFDRD